MIRTFGLVFAIGACAVATASAQALDPELTMRPMPNPTDLPSAVTEMLALPEAASDIAVERSADGLARANENRARAAGNRAEALTRAAERRAARLEMAAEARERGAEFGADVAEAARGVRESLVRGADLQLPIPVSLPELPDRVPARSSLPEPPTVELPERPQLPEQAGGGA